MLWTDTFQMSIVIIGVIVLLVAGAEEAGGFSKVWDIADENGRLEFDKYVYGETALLFLFIYTIENVLGRI